MTNQELFDNFVNKLHGIGPCIISKYGDRHCIYIKDDHPGCAIGCQPKFREVMSEYREDIEDDTVWSLCNRFPYQMKCIFGDFDELFMKELQNFHDHDENWEGDFLKISAVKSFCKKHSLNKPKWCKE